ncbi:thiamine phosphate synthase [Arthrobacter cupressi]|uniref:Thiamine-phosphate synthase n=1 Tax=Arthrobacter cupressi TaxID=1045773 RepID=A0A1G8PB23_9MICC|nr:thiamine phosphate synthase [Arthrobacter cupressi]NYD76780.1 thiamine-phosphate pyrophosphorylase [Arthrobacter cupressi]SDI89536.1 thiamine-phosphate pyrophosphorylase [Arthrobacter cupressi]
MTQHVLHTTARLYLCTDARKQQGDFEQFVDAAFEGGVDIIQLRDKTIEAAEELELLEVLHAVAHRHGRLWAVNDRADIASLSGAPVFHIGQKDLPLRSARKLLHDPTVIGLSTHTPEQVDAAIAASPGRSGLDYFCVGPVWATPTKPGRDAVGLDLVKYAASAVRAADEERVGGVNLPWFAIGGIDHGNVEQVVQAGASRIVVVRAITEASDPTAAAQALLAALP